MHMPFALLKPGPQVPRTHAAQAVYVHMPYAQARPPACASGRHVLEVPYKGESEMADVTADGAIIWKGQKFTSPSAFSVAVKRMYNPKRKADDGWKSVKYNGR